MSVTIQRMSCLKPYPSPSCQCIGLEESQDNRTECSGNSSSGSGGLNVSQISNSSSSDTDQHEPIMPNDISQSCDDKPVQPQLLNLQKTRVGNRNCSFAVHWYQSYNFFDYSIQRDSVNYFSCIDYFLHISVTLTQAFQQRAVTNGRKSVRN